MQDVIGVKLVANTKDYEKNMSGAERAVRSQIRALEAHADTLRKEIRVMKEAGDANRVTLRTKQRLVAETRDNINSLKREAAAAKDNARANKEAAKSAKASAGAVSTLSGAFSKLTVVLGTVTALLSSFKLIGLADEFNSLSGRVRNLTEETGNFNQVMSGIVSLASQTGASLADTTDTVQRLSFGLRDIGKTDQEILKITGLVQKLGVTSGASNEEMSNGIRQFSQAMSGGIVRAEEFNSILENTPGLAVAIADGLGLSVGQLRQMVIQGNLTAEQVFKALVGQTEKIEAQFAAMPLTVERATKKMGNAFQGLIGWLDQVTGQSQTLARAIQGVATLFNTLQQRLQPFAGTIRRLYESNKDLIASFLSMLKAFNDIIPFTETLKFLFKSLVLVTQVMTTALANGFDSIATGLKNVREGFLGLAKGDVKGAISSVLNNINGQMDRSKKRAEDLKDSFDNLFLGKKDGIDLTPQGQGTGQKRPPRESTVDPKDTGKALKALQQREKQALADILSRGRFSLRRTDLEGQERLQALGAFATEAERTRQEAENLEQVLKGLDEVEQDLINTSVKTAQAQKQKEEALSAVRLQSRQTQLELGRLWQEDLRRVQQMREQLFALRRDAELGELNQVIERREAQLQGMNAQLQSSYNNQLITVREFYQGQIQIVNEHYENERQKVHERIKLAKKELEVIAKTADEVRKKRIQNQIEQLEGQLNNINQRESVETQTIQVRYEDELKKAGNDLREQTKSALSGAIVEALTGSGTRGAIEQFGQAMKTAIITSFAEALSQRLINSDTFQGLFQQIGSAVNKASGQAEASAGGVATSTASLSKGNIAALAAILGGGIAQSRGGTAGSLLGGALSGAGTGFMFGGPVGAGIGAAAGLGLGAFQDQQIGGYVKAFAKDFFLDPISLFTGITGDIYGIVKGIDSINKLRDQRKANELAAIQLQDIMGGIDQENLNLGDLQGRQSQILNLAVATKGKATFLIGAFQKVQELIRQRRKQIDQFIEEISEQNQQLEEQLEIALAEPFEQATLSRKIELDRLDRQTEEALKAFADSEEAKTKILESESLRRQLINEKARESFEEEAQSLKDLLAERDAIENSNVFTRRKTQEAVKAENLQAIDKDIAQALQSVQNFSGTGLQLPEVEGINRLIQAANQVTQTNSFQIQINQAEDPEAVGEEVTRQIQALFKKYGTGVAV